MKISEPIELEKAAVCKESWWVTAKSREEFTRLQRERQAVLSPAFGSAPVSLVPSATEAMFIDRKKR